MPPVNGLTSAAASLRYWERRSEVTAHNLANASTDGFKAERVFGRLLGAGGEGGTVAQTATDLRAGTFRTTDNPLDLALGTDGFLVVNTPAGERFTRGAASDSTPTAGSSTPPAARCSASRARSPFPPAPASPSPPTAP